MEISVWGVLWGWRKLGGGVYGEMEGWEVHGFSDLDFRLVFILIMNDGFSPGRY